MKQKNKKKLEALNQLKNVMLKCKDKKCFAIVKSVSSSGMSRVIHFVAITKNGDIYNLDNMIHKITGDNFNKDYNGLRVYGCGMDMIFNTLYNVNSYARIYNVVKTSKKRSAHDIQYNGIINTNYNYF